MYLQSITARIINAYATIPYTLDNQNLKMVNIHGDRIDFVLYGQVLLSTSVSYVSHQNQIKKKHIRGKKLKI